MQDFEIKNFNSPKLIDFSLVIANGKISLLVAPTKLDRDLNELVELIGKESAQRMQHALGSSVSDIEGYDEDNALGTDTKVSTAEFHGFLPVVNLRQAAKNFSSISLIELFALDNLLAELFLSKGTVSCPVCNEEVARSSLDEVVSLIKTTTKQDTGNNTFVIGIALDRLTSKNKSPTEDMQQEDKLRSIINAYTLLGYQRFIVADKLLRVSARDFESLLGLVLNSTKATPLSPLIAIDSFSELAELEIRCSDALEEASKLGLSAIKIFKTKQTSTELEDLATISAGLYCKRCNNSFPHTSIELVQAEISNAISSFSRKKRATTSRLLAKNIRHGKPKLALARMQLFERSISSTLEMSVEKFASSLKNIAARKNPGSGDSILKPIHHRLALLAELGLSKMTLKSELQELSFSSSVKAFLAAYRLREPASSLVILENPSELFHPKDMLRVLKDCKSLARNCNAVMLTERNSYLAPIADINLELCPTEEPAKADTIFFRIEDANKEIAKKEYFKTSIFSKTKLKQEIKFPQNSLVAVVGVSGAGKTHFLKNLAAQSGEISQNNANSSLRIFYNAGLSRNQKTRFGGLKRGQNIAEALSIVERIACIFAKQSAARQHGLTKEHFSKTNQSGVCKTCHGLGANQISVEGRGYKFDQCERCYGSGYAYEVLSVDFRTKSIAEIFSASFNELRGIFSEEKTLFGLLEDLVKLGLGECSFKKSLVDLTPLEFSRLMLAKVFASTSLENQLHLLDQPFLGLELNSNAFIASRLEKYLANGGSMLFSTHNLQVISLSDWVIEFGENSEVLYSGFSSLFPKDGFSPDLK